MFRRNTQGTRWQRVKSFLWPSMGMHRLVRYYRHRMGRLPGTPYFIASGFAAGFAVSFTPFIGFHLMLAGIIALAMRGSLVAMALGTLIAGNPWTFPFIWVGTYELGKVMLGQHGNASISHEALQGFTLSNLLDKPMELLLPMTLGSIPLAVVSWLISFYFVRQLVKGYKETRLARIYKRDEKH